METFPLNNLAEKFEVAERHRQHAGENDNEDRHVASPSQQAQPRPECRQHQEPQQIESPRRVAIPAHEMAHHHGDSPDGKCPGQADSHYDGNSTQST
jgi:hypothetical protein